MVFVLVSARASDSKAMFLYNKHTHTLTAGTVSDTEH